MLFLEVVEEHKPFVVEKSASLTITSYFFYKDDPKPINTEFYACYRLDESVTMSSISTKAVYDKGDIIFYDDRAKENRIGSLVMYLKVLWLKSKYPLDMPVHGIHFKPAGSRERAANFYNNFGVPICGNSFKCNDLILHKSWKRNIKRVKDSEIISSIFYYENENQTLQEDINIIKNLNTLSISAFDKINIFNFLTYRDFSYRPNSLKNYCFIDVFNSHKVSTLQNIQRLSCAKTKFLNFTSQKEELILKNKQLDATWKLSSLNLRLKKASENLWDLILRHLILIMVIILVVKYSRQYLF